MTDPQQDSQPLVEHLTELRVRVVRILIASAIGMAVCYNFTERIFDFIRKPIAKYLDGGGLIFTAPMDKFLAHLKLAFFGGVILVFPYIVWQVWLFVAPGLCAKEKKSAYLFIFVGSLLFVTGLSFAYFVVFPAAFQFLMTFGGNTDHPMISISEYMSFFTMTSLAFGFAFEMPLIIVILAMLEIVSQAFLKRNRRYAVMILAVLAAVITPPDLLSMLMMLGPLWLLYEIAIFAVGIVETRRESVSKASSQQF